MKTYLRFLWRNKLYSAIQFVGLSVALAFMIIFTCYVRQQLAVCTHYEDSENIYIVGIWSNIFSDKNLHQHLQDNIPEITESALIQEYYNQYTFDGAISSDKAVIVVGKDFFDVFKTKFIYGSPEDFNVSTNAFVTESFANRNGGLDVIGKKLIDKKREFEIAGIIEDFTNSIFDNYEIIVNAAHKSYMDEANYISSAHKTFIKVKEGTDVEELKNKLTTQIREHSGGRGEADGKDFTMFRLDELYFTDGYQGRYGMKRENPDRVIIFCIVVLFLLVSAIINYINLSNASARRRAKDVAIRHIFGEGRVRIVQKIFMECFLFTSVSFVAALCIATLVLDGVNGLILSGVPISIPFSADYILVYLLIVLGITVICGGFVSFLMPKIKIGSSSIGRKSMSKLFIGLQLVLSFIMISTALTMELQMKHILNRDMNANLDNIYHTNCNFEEALSEFKKLPFVKKIGISTGYPGNFGMGVRAAGDNSVNMSIIRCDSVAFRLFGFEKILDFTPDNLSGVWLSESAAKHYGVDADNREWPSIGDYPKTVTGVVKDVPVTSLVSHMVSPFLQDAIGIINVMPDDKVGRGSGDYFLEVEQTKEHKKILDKIVSEIYLKKTGRELSRYGFLHDLHKEDYDQNIRDMRLIELFMVIAIILSSLAFFAMSVHYASNNRKPIAVHKVFGGDTASELRRCMGVYFKIMAVAVAIGLPVSVWISSHYLEQFAYRINLAEKWWIFVVAIAISLFISTATVLWQTLSAARTNPVESLKSE